MTLILRRKGRELSHLGLQSRRIRCAQTAKQVIYPLGCLRHGVLKRIFGVGLIPQQVGYLSAQIGYLCHKLHIRVFALGVASVVQHIHLLAQVGPL